MLNKYRLFAFSNLKTKKPKFEKTYQILGLLKHLDFFQSFPIDKVQEFLMTVS